MGLGLGAGRRHDPRPRYRRERNADLQFGVIAPSRALERIREGIVEHILALAMGLKITRQDALDPPRRILQHQMLAKPAGLARRRSRRLERQQKRMFDEGIAGQAGRIRMCVPRLRVYLLQRAANPDLQVNLTDGNPQT